VPRGAPAKLAIAALGPPVTPARNCANPEVPGNDGRPGFNSGLVNMLVALGRL